MNAPLRHQPLDATWAIGASTSGKTASVTRLPRAFACPDVGPDAARAVMALAFPPVPSEWAACLDASRALGVSPGTIRRVYRRETGAKWALVQAAAGMALARGRSRDDVLRAMGLGG